MRAATRPLLACPLFACSSVTLSVWFARHAITRNKLDYMKTDWALMEDLWEWMFEDDLEIDADE